MPRRLTLIAPSLLTSRAFPALVVHLLVTVSIVSLAPAFIALVVCSIGPNFGTSGIPVIVTGFVINARTQ